MNTIGLLPTTSKRRMQQAINLAQRLQAKQRESEQYLRQIKDKQDEIDKLKEELAVARQLVDRVN